VETIQERHFQMRNVAMDALMALIADIKPAGAGGASQAQLDEARRWELALRGVNPGAAPLPQPVTPQLPVTAAAAAR
jgi:hypothetical protein